MTTTDNNVTTASLAPRLEIVAKSFKPRVFVKAAQTTSQQQEMIRVMASAIEADAKALVHGDKFAVLVGEIFHNLLKAKPEPFEEYVKAYAQATGVDAPDVFPEAKRGRRNILASVAYGKHPELLRKQQGMKDSRAGLRITYFLRAYRVKAGLRAAAPPRRKASQVSGAPRAFKPAFVQMWASATPEQQIVLRAVCEAAKMDVTALLSWVTPRVTKTRKQRHNVRKVA